MSLLESRILEGPQVVLVHPAAPVDHGARERGQGLESRVGQCLACAQRVEYLGRHLHALGHGAVGRHAILWAIGRAGGYEDNLLLNGIECRFLQRLANARSMPRLVLAARCRHAMGSETQSPVAPPRAPRQRGRLGPWLPALALLLSGCASQLAPDLERLYQMFPHPLNDWVLSHNGTPLERDVFDIEIWRRFEWSIFDPAVRRRIAASFASEAEAAAHLASLERAFHRNLERARRFVWSLTVALERVPWTMVAFGGTCHLTPARIVIEEVGGESVGRLWPQDIRRPVEGVDYDRLMLEPGDRRVTKASLLARETLDPSVPRHPYSFFPVDGSIFLCEAHDRLATNINFQDNLLQFLLSQD